MRSPPGSTSETTTPLRPVRDRGPDDLDTVCLELCRDELAGRVVARLPMKRACAAERRGPGGDVRGLPARAGAVAPSRRRRGERPVESDDDVEQEITEGADEHRLQSSHGRTTTRPTSLVRDRRARRRLRRARRRPGVPPGSAAASRPAGLAAFEDAPCYQEIVELEERGAQ